MRLDPDLIRKRCAVLGGRDWPSEWGQAEAERIGDYLGWCHRYRFEDPCPEGQVAQFESQYLVSLPGEYRHFITKVSNGGAGPGFGIYRLGEEEADPLPSEILAALDAPFALREAWNDTSLLSSPERYYGYEIMAGAMPIATEGCAIDYWMVGSGPEAGQIWLDRRTDKEGIAPIIDDTGAIMTFGPWYQSWLDAAWANYKPD